jgi:hypothetical protein
MHKPGFGAEICLGTRGLPSRDLDNLGERKRAKSCAETDVATLRASVGSPPTYEREEDKMSETETMTCMYPGCERPAVDPPKHGGPPPRYCEDETHHASSAYQAMKAEGKTIGDGSQTHS